MKSIIKSTVLIFTVLAVFIFLINTSFAADSKNNTPGNENNGFAEENILTTITGRISLPQGMVADRDINVFIYAQNDFSNDEYYEYSTVLIPKGSDSASYSICASPNCDYIVSFFVDDYIAGLLNKGYYSVNGTVIYESGASLVHLNDEDTANIDINILEGINIEGTISLPDKGLAPENGVEVLLSAFRDNENPYEFEDNYAADSVFTIPEGKNSVKYFITVPPSKASGYIINYYISPENMTQYLNTGYYSASGTTFDRDNATTIIPNKGSIENVNFTLLKGKELKVTLKIPDDVPLQEDLLVTVAAFSGNGTDEDYSDDYYSEKEIKIPSGKKSFSTALYVAPDLKSGYILSYSLETDLKGYLPSAYYGKNSMVSSMTKAFPVVIGKSNPKNIQMTFIKGVKISGVLSAGSSGSSNIAPKSVIIIAESDNNTPGNYMDDLYYCTNIDISGGKNSVPYEIYVAPDQSYNLLYCQFDSPDYNETGYYGKNGTVLSKESSDKLSVKNRELCKINLKLTTG